MRLNLFILSLSVLCLAAGCVSGAAAPSGPLPTQAGATAEAADASADESAQDLFPAKTKLDYATAFTVEYHENYKIVTVVNPWRGAQQAFRYVLVQRGTAAPAGEGQAQVIEIPVTSIASLSATHMPYLDELGVLDTLTAVGESKYINTPGVVERIRSGKAREVGNGLETNIETLMDLQPEVVTTLALGNPRKDNYQQLQQKGLKTVIISDFSGRDAVGARGMGQIPGLVL